MFGEDDVVCVCEVLFNWFHCNLCTLACMATPHSLKFRGLKMSLTEDSRSEKISRCWEGGLLNFNAEYREGGP